MSWTCPPRRPEARALGADAVQRGRLRRNQRRARAVPRAVALLLWYAAAAAAAASASTSTSASASARRLDRELAQLRLLEHVRVRHASRGEQRLELPAAHRHDLVGRRAAAASAAASTAASSSACVLRGGQGRAPEGLAAASRLEPHARALREDGKDALAPARPLPAPLDAREGVAQRRARRRQQALDLLFRVGLG